MNCCPLFLHLFSDLGEIRYKNPHIILLNSSEFHENRLREGRTFLRVYKEIHLNMYHRTV
jgi:hypothetical protein